MHLHNLVLIVSCEWVFFIFEIRVEGRGILEIRDQLGLKFFAFAVKIAFIIAQKEIM